MTRRTYEHNRTSTPVASAAQTSFNHNDPFITISPSNKASKTHQRVDLLPLARDAPCVHGGSSAHHAGPNAKYHLCIMRTRRNLKHDWPQHHSTLRILRIRR